MTDAPRTILGLPVAVTGRPAFRRERKRDILRDYKARQAASRPVAYVDCRGAVRQYLPCRGGDQP